MDDWDTPSIIIPKPAKPSTSTKEDKKVEPGVKRDNRPEHSKKVEPIVGVSRDNRPADKKVEPVVGAVRKDYRPEHKKVEPVEVVQRDYRSADKKMEPAGVVKDNYSEHKNVEPVGAVKNGNRPEHKNVVPVAVDKVDGTEHRSPHPAEVAKKVDAPEEKKMEATASGDDGPGRDDSHGTSDVVANSFFCKVAHIDPNGGGTCLLILGDTEHFGGTTIGDTGIKVNEEVIVMLAQGKLVQGVLMGKQPNSDDYKVLRLDTWELEVFKGHQLFAQSRLQIIPCLLNNLKLFTETKMLERVLKESVEQGRVTPGMRCTASCVGVRRGANPMPIMDVWPYTTADKPKRGDMSFNMDVAKRCIAIWTSELKKPPHAHFGGSIVHVANDGKIAIQYPSGDDDCHAYYMDMYLSQFNVTDLAKNIGSVDHVAATKGVYNKTVFLAEFTQDGLVYRARIVEVLPGRQAKVEFIDYGNTDVVSYDCIFEAGRVDKVLELVPPLVWNAYMFGVLEVYVGTENKVLELFQQEAELNFEISGGLRNGHPLVSIYAKEEHGDGRRNMFQVLESLSYIRTIGVEQQ